MRFILIHNGVTQPAPPCTRASRVSSPMTDPTLSLADLPLKAPAVVVDVRSPAQAPELADRLAEIGFLPGEPVRVMMRAAGGDPLAVRVSDSTFALRRVEADCVRVVRLAGKTAVR